MYLGRLETAPPKDIHITASPPATGAGPLLVCGGGPTLFEDLKDAPAAPVLAVNYAARLVRHDMVFTGHPTQADRMRTDAPLHVLAVKHEPIPACNHLWRAHPLVLALTSGGAAALIAKAMGYEPILCGVPIEATGHEAGYTDHAQGPEHGEFGSDVSHRHHIWSLFRDSGLLDGITSMSGFTRRLLGGPDGN